MGIADSSTPRFISMINNQFSFGDEIGNRTRGGHRLTEHFRKTASAVPEVPAGFNPLRFQRIDERVIARCVPERINGKINYYPIDFYVFILTHLFYHCRQEAIFLSLNIEHYLFG
ncbi:MAG: hypothetical protein P0Y63_26155 [Klebsiella huaxiensis]|uniref:hypothetical protein n=1 Tax=Klebsiella TaxID=570 RepID=UPI0015F588AC|nr:MULTISPECIES: hypothetical protein [Klebsiella]MBA7931342.1 hypothetical protein [Klebsiella sp. RHBSTW-00215]WEJ88701.1 MAG: hypothetical protein P0Y63_26155 [Klebsiella huaxiensis]